MPRKKIIKEINMEFNEFVNQYKEVSKEISALQIEMNKKDKIRDDILSKIRHLQNSNNCKLDYNLLLDVNSSNKNVELSDNLESTNEIVNENIIKSKSSLTLEEIVIKKPNKKQSIETDDDSVDISDDICSSD